MMEFFGSTTAASADEESVLGVTFERRVDMEIALYKQEQSISIDKNPLEWWKSNVCKYPLISLIARRYMSVQATSVASERVFSVAGDILTAKRSQLAAENVNKLVFLKQNFKLA